MDLINDDMGHSLEIRVSLQSPQDDPRGTEQQPRQRGLEQRNTDTLYQKNYETLHQSKTGRTSNVDGRETFYYTVSRSVVSLVQ